MDGYRAYYRKTVSSEDFLFYKTPPKQYWEGVWVLEREVMKQNLGGEISASKIDDLLSKKQAVLFRHDPGSPKDDREFLVRPDRQHSKLRRQL